MLKGKVQMVLPLAAIVAVILSMGVAVNGQQSAPKPTPTPLVMQNAPVGSPTYTVKEFYRLMRERKFHEAFAITIFKPAIDGLSKEDFEELRPDFESLAAVIPANFEITGEQVTGDRATVFMKVANLDEEVKTDTVTLKRISAADPWIIISQPEEEKATVEAIKKYGKDYFFLARIDVHEDDARDMLERIVKAEFVYQDQNSGFYADLNLLVKQGLLPEDVLGAKTTGYRYRVMLSGDKRRYSVGAEPERYGRTGKLSFLIEDSRLTSKDLAGKPMKD